MTQSTYQDGIALAHRVLLQTRHLLTLAQKQVGETDLTEGTVLEAKLAPDMFAFAKQVQLVSDNAKGLYGRVTGQAVPSMQDTEASIDELLARIDTTIAYVSGGYAVLSDSEIESLAISFPWMPGKQISGHDYLVDLAIPNLYFHFSMVYAILRAQGISVGKMDYLGDVRFVDAA